MDSKNELDHRFLDSLGKVKGINVDIWIEDANDFLSQKNEYLEILSKEEIDRASQFRYASEQLFYEISHARLRLKLSEKTGIFPSEIEYLYTDFGKPYFPGSTLAFNLSRSRNYFAYIIEPACECGIDLEILYEPFEMKGILNNYFSLNERNYILNANDKKEELKRFYIVWTRKESFLKMTGIGLNSDLQDTCVFEKAKNEQIWTNSFIHKSCIISFSRTKV